MYTYIEWFSRLWAVISGRNITFIEVIVWFSSCAIQFVEMPEPASEPGIQDVSVDQELLAKALTNRTSDNLYLQAFPEVLEGSVDASPQ